MVILRFAECPSTNALAKEMAAEMEGPAIISVHTQTQGRGQKGNSWESEPGKNLTFSMMWHPKDFEACRQFVISEAIALSVTDLLKENRIEARVKWPNDIYVGDLKICGILIEHSLAGRNIDHTVAGVGINVNQTAFHSDAPNPVSMSQLSGLTYDPGCLLDRFSVIAEGRIRRISDQDGKRETHREFLDNLWRGDSAYYPFLDRNSGIRYSGKIVNVDESGFLEIEDEKGDRRKYAFKEVEFLLNGGN